MDAVKAVTVALYVAAMLGVGFVVKWMVHNLGLWTIIPWLAVFFFVAWQIDQRDKRKRNTQ